jgi:SP family myo-inositol transporter-like MFS transporter 13
MSEVYDEKGTDATLRKEDEAGVNDLGRDLATGEVSEMTVIAEGEERTTIFVWLLVCASSISGLLFGELCRLQECLPSH